MLTVFALMVPGLVAVPASADGADRRRADEPVVYQARTHYDFDDDVVEGDLLSPDELIVRARQRSTHPSLIKIREHFVPEMSKSAEEL